MIEMRDHRRRVGARFYASLLVIAVATFLVHEGAHWAMGRALGHAMVFGLNGTGPVGAVSMSDHLWISAAGVIVTLIQGAAGFLMAMRRESLVGYGMLFFAALMRLMAAGVSVFNPNDEARISQELGLGLWTLPAATVAVLVVLTVIASRRLGLSWRTNLLTYLIATLALSAIVGLDMVLKG